MHQPFEGLDVFERNLIFSSIHIEALKSFGYQQDCFLFGISDQQAGLCFTFSAGDLGLAFTFCHADLIFSFAFRGEDLGTFITFGAHLFFHGVADLFRGLDFLQFHAVHFHAPFIGGFIQDVAQLHVHRIPGSESKIQRELTNHVTQRGLGQLLDCFGKVTDLIDCFVRIGDLEIEQRVDVHGHVIGCDHVLAWKVIDVFPQVNAVFHLLHHDHLSAVIRFVVAPMDRAHFIEDGDDDVNAAGKGFVILTQAFDDYHFGLPHHDQTL